MANFAKGQCFIRTVFRCFEKKLKKIKKFCQKCLTFIFFRNIILLALVSREC